MPLISFFVEVEIEDEQEVGDCELDEVLREMEEICAKHCFALHDSAWEEME